MSRTVLSLIAFTAIAAAALASGPPPTSAQSTEETTTRMEWLTQPYLHVEFQADKVVQGGTELSGYVYNDAGQPANNVWLEITEIDQSGETVGYLTRHVDELIPAKGRAYFDVRVPASASYQVVPQAGEFVEGFGGN